MVDAAYEFLLMVDDAGEWPISSEGLRMVENGGQNDYRWWASRASNAEGIARSSNWFLEWGLDLVQNS